MHSGMHENDLRSIIGICSPCSNPHPTKNPPPDGSEGGLCQGRSVCPRRYEANTRSQYKSVVVDVASRCGEARGFEQVGKVMLPVLPPVLMDGIAGNRGLGLEAFEGATWAEIFIGDAEVVRGLAFEALGLIGACLCQLHRVLVVPADQVGVAVDQLTQTALEGAHEVALCLIVIDAGKAADRNGFEDRQAACDEIGGGITKGLAKGGDLAKSFVDVVDLSGGSG
jgi:hypothetical protein